jgi:hypothetical protein
MCVSNNTGLNNLFVVNAGHASFSSGGPNMALALGLGLGLGIPFLLAMGFLIWFLIRRRQRTRQPSMDSNAPSNMTEAKQPSMVETNPVPENAE